jgi:hypothetical protein
MEMRQRVKSCMLYAWRTLSFTMVVLLVSGSYSAAQDPLKMCTVSDGRMQIVLDKQLPEKELDNFIAQFELGHLALKRFIKTGFSDSIDKHGWEIRMNSPVSFMITKLLLGADIDDPAGRIKFIGNNPAGDNPFPSVNSSVRFGYNRFRNKQFRIHEGMARFFLRGNKEAKKVTLAGSFNNWDPDALTMTRTDSGWIASVNLVPGKYWYKFIVDGNWTIDTDNRNSENDGQGNTNSVFYFTNNNFILPGYLNAKRVILSGSFNNWNEKELIMNKYPGGWELPMYLANGTHTYRFIVDKDWITDPTNPNRLPNEFNDFNSVVSIGDPHHFKLQGYQDAKKVILSGSFNGWRDNELFMSKTATGWEIPYVLGPGNYEYKFIVDGKSIADPARPESATENRTSYLVLNPNYTFRLKEFKTAKKVFLSGEFNGWSPNSLPMKMENGEWVFRVHLSRGKHLYKFVVDGEWILDPANKLWEQNEHNTGNSVLWIEK